MPKTQLAPAPKAKRGESSVHLDQTTLARMTAPAAGSKLVLDDQIPGFCVQMTYTGTRTFRIRYRRAGKWYSVKIGRWRDGKEPAPKKGEPLPQGTEGKLGFTAGQARALAANLRTRIERGDNPAVEKRLEQANQAIAERGLVTIATAYAEYLAYLRNRGEPMAESSIEQVEKSFDHHILPLLGKDNLPTLTKGHVEKLAQEAKRKRTQRGRQLGGPSAARHAITHLSAFLAWAVKQELAPFNVVQRITRNDILPKEKKRERYLSPAEWKMVMVELTEWPYWSTRGSRISTKTLRLDRPQLRQLVSCEALRVALSTGARKGEVFKMRWADVDLDGGFWNKPAQTMKSRKSHSIALPAQAIESLRALRAAHGDPVFVFPGKARLDKITQRLKLKGDQGGPVKDVHELWTRIRSKLGIEDVRIHDLRHTAASVLISSGASLHEVGEALGHSQAQTTMRYAHMMQEAKKRTASRMDAFAAEQMGTAPAAPAKRSNRRARA